MAEDRGLDIDQDEDAPEGAPKPGARAKDKSLLEGTGIEDGVSGTAGEVKTQDQ